MDRRIKIAFIGGASKNPIPAVKGGAIQTLVTAWIDENEKAKYYDFIVYSKYCSDVTDIQKKYSRTTFRYIKITCFDELQLFLCKVVRRLTKNRVPYKSKYMKTVNKMLGDDKPDVIICESTDKVVVQLKESSYANSKVYFHIHADYLNNDTDRITTISQICDGYIAISEFIKRRLSGLNSINPQSITVIKNAIDIGDISEHEKVNARIQIRSSLGIGEEEIVLVYCGRLSPEKGCLELIKAVNKTNCVKLIVIGGNDFSSNKKTKYVKQLENEKSKSENRVFFTGYIPHDEIWKYFSAGDIGVVPSICNEAASLTAVEFRKAGLPTIVTDIGGIPEYCNKKTSIFVKLDEKYVERLAEAINFLALNDEMRLSLAKNARLDLEEYSYKQYYERLHEFIGNLHISDNNEVE